MTAGQSFSLNPTNEEIEEDMALMGKPPPNLPSEEESMAGFESPRHHYDGSEIGVDPELLR